MPKRIVILGAGGHAKVLAYILELMGQQVVGFTDDNGMLHASTVFGYPVLGHNERVPDLPIDAAIVGIGDNAPRQRWFEQLQRWGVPLAQAIHPSALIARGARLGEGCAILANVSINVDAVLGDDVVVNTAGVVGHDCEIGDHVHVGPCALTCGGVKVGRGVFLGAGATLLPQVCVGDDAVVGAGSVVLKDVPARAMVVGNPARVLRPAATPPRAGP